MTCIVGLVEGGHVIMGADSAGVGGLDIQNRKDVKVFTNGDFVIGCTTSFRMIQLLQYKLSPPKRHPDADVMRFMVTDFIEEIRRLFRDGGFATKEKEAENGGTFLVGHAGRLFRIDSDYQVGERADGFDACGCGESYALGSMACTTGMASQERVRRALEVAAHFSAGVRAPFVILEQRGPHSVADKFDEVLIPFLSLMRKELHANTGKGDRPGWLKMGANEALLETYYHLAKLQKAVRDNDGPGIMEYSADVANMAMMVLDVCGGLAWVEAEPWTIDMLLFCPECGTQHIDGPDDRTPGWDNPPHKSHLCHWCKTVWRPAEAPTNGVACIVRGKSDTWLVGDGAAPARSFGLHFHPATQAPVKPEGASFPQAVLYNQCDGFHLAFARFDSDGAFDGFYDWAGTDPYEPDKHFCAWALLPDSTTLFEPFARKAPYVDPLGVEGRSNG